MAGRPMSTAAIPRQAVAIGAAAPVKALPVLAVWLAPAVVVLRVEEDVVEAEVPCAERVNRYSFAMSEVLGNSQSQWRSQKWK